MKYIERHHDINTIKELMDFFPVTAILGSRQCGKTVLANMLHYDHYFDLENPHDYFQLSESPQITLENLSGTIVIDEVQLIPELFTLLRYLVDHPKVEQKYLILGSSSHELRTKSAESLAGRIGTHILSGLTLLDIGTSNFKKLWLVGGYPKAYTAKDEHLSFLWLKNYIQSHCEKDIPRLGVSISAPLIYRFWTMLSHYHGNMINYSDLGRSFGIADTTVRKYLEILSGTFLIRLLQPWHTNTGKRLVKRPKIYIRDSGVFHSLQSISDTTSLQSNPMLGASWEGYALEAVTRLIQKRDEELFFYRTHNGTEIDLYFKENGRNIGIEFKYSDTPKNTKSIVEGIKELQLDKLFIVYPGDRRYQLNENVEIVGISHLSNKDVFNF